jgi:hypothetical protein
VLANMRVLFGLVTMRPSHASDDAAESMPVVARLGGTDDHQGVVVNHPDAISDRQGATTDCMVLLLAVKVPSSTARVSPAIIRVPPPPRYVDRGGHQSRHIDLHNCPMVGANYHGL